jgi:hypothetical protein
MAAQRSAFSRTQRLARRCFRRLIAAKIITSVGKTAPLVALIFALLLTALGQPAPKAQAAPAASSNCPTWYTDGAAQCQGKVTEVGPPLGGPPPGGIVLGSWIACVPYSQIFAWFYNPNPDVWEHWWDDPSVEEWSGNFYVWMVVFPDTIEPAYPWPDASPTNVFQPIPPAPNPPGNWQSPPPGGWPPCPPPKPPCTTCFPVPTFQDVFYDFWAYAPTAVVSGRSSCTDGSFQECPPSVGHPVQFWVDRFVSNKGPTTACTDLSNVGVYSILYQSLILCIQWRLGEQVGSYSWSFDDEEVDPNTGQGSQVAGVNIDVPGGTGPDNPVSHVFQYSSAYNPLRRCVRPCPGDLNGPNGSPAFQVSVSSNWWLYSGISINGQPLTWTRIDLRDFGAPQPYFTSVTTVPVPVFSYGSVTTP